MAASLASTFRPGWALTVLVGAALLVLIGLGSWQVQRLQWKLDLIAEIEAGLVAEPVPLPADPEAIIALDHRPVSTAGLLRYDLAFARGSAQKGGVPGARLVVPLERPGAAPIIVDMGWMPEPVETFLDALPDAGEAALDGTVYLDHLPAKPSFRPANEPEGRRWYWYDNDALRAWTGLVDLVPATLVRRPDGIERTPPIADPPALNVRNDHLGYALTWYGLALGLAVIYLMMGRARAKELST
jgi:surfeit locus 1 family protein